MYSYNFLKFPGKVRGSFKVCINSFVYFSIFILQKYMTLGTRIPGLLKSALSTDIRRLRSAVQKYQCFMHFHGYFFLDTIGDKLWTFDVMCCDWSNF